MPFLLYCICEAQAKVTPPAAGVRGAVIADLILNGLRCFYSEISAVAADAVALKQEAIEFHRVAHAIFQSAAIIPFRFPTLVPEANDITAFLASHAKEYTETLARLRGTAQMEIRVACAMAPAKAASGTSYLRARAETAKALQAAASGFASAGQAYTLEWRQRISRDGVHCYALVRREDVYNFEQALQALRLDAALKAVISGPWPATEFLPMQTPARAEEEQQTAKG